MRDWLRSQGVYIRTSAEEIVYVSLEATVKATLLWPDGEERPDKNLPRRIPKVFISLFNNKASQKRRGILVTSDIIRQSAAGYAQGHVYRLRQS
jgi:hypothetical protein